MKVENDTPFAVHASPAEGPNDRAIVSIVLKGTFTIVPGSEAELVMPGAPIAFADESGEGPDGPLPRLDSDVAPFKPAADVILLGRAYAPAGKPAPHVDVRLRVGTRNKTLRVFGAREWKPGGFGREPKISDPEPFRHCDLSWAHAYGGPASAANPAGIGWLPENPKIRKKDIEGQPLPRIEDPANLIAEWKDRPEPAGFATVGRGWEPRARHLGTWDDAWKAERAPRPPRDFSFAFHNAAPADQQVEGWLRGGESFAIVNATKDGRLSGKLPRLAVEVAVRREGKAVEEPVTMNLDTLVLEPEALRMTLVWRGTPAIPALDRLDVEEIRFRTLAG